MAPKHNGDTLTPAVGDRIWWYPRTLFGVAAGVKDILSFVCNVNLRVGREVKLVV